MQRQNPDHNGRLKRTQRSVAQRPGVSRFQQVAFNQGAIEEIINDFLRKDGKVRVERNVECLDLQLEHSAVDRRDSYPIILNVRRGRISNNDADGIDGLNGDSGATHLQKNYSDSDVGTAQSTPPMYGLNTIKAKYLVGCDGAHSWTREQIGVSLSGGSTDQVWGVMDIVPLTDFRKFSTIIVIME